MLYRFISGVVGLVGLVTMSSMLLALPAFAVAPSNDDFADREVLSGSLPIEVPGSNLEATKELEEPEVGAFAAGHSVWFEWEAPSSGWFTVGACGSDFEAVIGIFTGTELASLSRVVQGNAAEGPDCPYRQRQYSFEAVDGTAYVIGVDGNGFSFPEGPSPDDEGTIQLLIEPTPPPDNDDLAGATQVIGSLVEEGAFYGASVWGYNWQATKELGEPAHAGDPGGASVWYSWTAPGSGTAAFYPCCGPEFLVGVYTGSSLGALTPVITTAGPPGGAVTADVSAGTTYRIAVDGKQDESTGDPYTSSFEFRISMTDPALPPPDPTIIEESFPIPADTAPPETDIARRMLRPAKRRVTFFLRASEPDSTFLCRIDKRAFSPCRSPKTYRHLGRGWHAFRAAAVDPAGNVDPSPAVTRFKIPQPKNQRKR